MKQLRIRNSISIHDIDEKDGRLAYQAYRLGQLPENWHPVDGLKPQNFINTLEDFIDKNYSHAWSVRDNGSPISIVFGVLASRFILVGDIIWSAKATPRQKLESGAKFFSELKNGIVFSDFDNKPFYDRLMDYGILRRVGTNYIEGRRLAQFETKQQK